MTIKMSKTYEALLHLMNLKVCLYEKENWQQFQKSVIKKKKLLTSSL